MPIACPRHGVVDVAKDAPCPVCGVAAYDLDDRGARDVLRANREHALKTRKTVAGVVVFAGTLALSLAFLPLRVVFLVDINLLAFVVAGAAAAAAARPLALALERDPQLRRLDAALSANRV